MFGEAAGPGAVSFGGLSLEEKAVLILLSNLLEHDISNRFYLDYLC